MSKHISRHIARHIAGHIGLIGLKGISRPKALKGIKQMHISRYILSLISRLLSRLKKAKLKRKKKGKRQSFKGI